MMSIETEARAYLQRTGVCANCIRPHLDIKAGLSLLVAAQVQPRNLRPHRIPLLAERLDEVAEQSQSDVACQWRTLPGGLKSLLLEAVAHELRDWIPDATVF